MNQISAGKQGNTEYLNCIFTAVFAKRTKVSQLCKGTKTVSASSRTQSVQ